MAKQLEALLEEQLSQMDSDGLRDLINRVRASRTMPKKTSKKAVKAKKATDKQMNKLKDLFASLSPEEQEAILKSEG